MSEEALYYAAIDGRENRSSHFYRDEGVASDTVDAQNARAVELGIKARYQLCSETDTSLILSKDIR